MARRSKYGILLAAIAALAACDEKNAASQPAPTASAAPVGQLTGTFCSPTEGSGCYDVDIPAGTITLMMGGQRGRSFPLERRDEDAYSFALAPNQVMWIRVRDADTIEVASAADTQAVIVLKRKR